MVYLQKLIYTWCMTKLHNIFKIINLISQGSFFQLWQVSFFPLWTGACMVFPDLSCLRLTFASFQLLHRLWHHRFWWNSSRSSTSQWARAQHFLAITYNDLSCSINSSAWARNLSPILGSQSSFYTCYSLITHSASREKDFTSYFQPFLVDSFFMPTTPPISV